MKAAAPRRSVQWAPQPELADSDGTVKVTYVIKPGDTLAGIASQYGTSVQKLQSWNGLKSSRIAAGDRLVIYTSLAAPARESSRRPSAAASRP